MKACSLALQSQPHPVQPWRKRSYAEWLEDALGVHLLSQILQRFWTKFILGKLASRSRAAQLTSCVIGTCSQQQALLSELICNGGNVLYCERSSIWCVLPGHEHLLLGLAMGPNTTLKVACTSWPDIISSTFVKGAMKLQMQNSQHRFTKSCIHKVMHHCIFSKHSIKLPLQHNSHLSATSTLSIPVVGRWS